MNINLPDLTLLSALIRDIGRDVLMPFFGHTTRSWKQDKSVITEADLATQQALQKNLRQHWPEIDFLGEEMPVAQQKALIQDTQNGLWVVDPLDGTSNFAAGIPYFGISVSLIFNGTVRLAVVYDPNRDELFAAERNKGAFLNNQPLKLDNEAIAINKSIAVIDFKRLDSALRDKLINTPPYSSQRSFGSVALDWCWLSAGRFHLYLHGRSNLWDYAAGLMIFCEAGGNSCSLDGKPVFDGNMQPRSCVGASSETLFQAWQDYLGIGR